MYVIVCISQVKDPAHDGHRMLMEVHGPYTSKAKALRDSKTYEYPCLAFVELVWPTVSEAEEFRK
jgi:hypothetical protein